MKTIWKKVAVSTLVLSLMGTCVYAGTVISTYKTVRGDYATVEKEEVHKNRIALNVDGKKMNTKSWYANGVTYVPMREAAEMLGADVNYNAKTQTAEITKKPIHPEAKIIKKSELPYTFDSKSAGIRVSINSINVIENKTVINVTATNYSNHNNDLLQSYWEMYVDNKKIRYTGSDDYLDSLYMNEIRPNMTVSGDIYFEELPTSFNKFILEPYIGDHSIGGNKESFSLQFDLFS